MENSFKRHIQSDYDIVIIGGGIQGAGIARELALRGFEVGLFEKGDFGSGTSSCSSKLIHGGLRYLVQYDFSLVRQALKEREILLRQAPHLVKKLDFLMPIYRHVSYSKWQIRLGLTLYDAFAGWRNYTPHRMYSPQETLATLPELNPNGLVGSASFYDAQMDDARLCLETILQAEVDGAEVFNYAQVQGAQYNDGKLQWVDVLDTLSQTTYQVRAKLYINTTGPWSDHVMQTLAATASPHLSLSKGVHLLFKALFTNKPLVFMTGEANRVMFVLPWGPSSTMVGTTDTPYEGDPSAAQVETADIEYIFKHLSALYPTHSMSKKDIIGAFAGVRPLISQKGRRSHVVSRKHHLYWDADNVLTVLGGKYTTYRSVSEEVAKKVTLFFERRKFYPLTAQLHLYGGYIPHVDTYVETHYSTDCDGMSLEKAQYKRLVERYAMRYKEVLGVIKTMKDGETLLTGTSYVYGEVRYAIQHEKAVTVADFMRRRTSIALDEPLALGCSAEVVQQFAAYYDWDNARIASEIQQVNSSLKNKF